MKYISSIKNLFKLFFFLCLLSSSNYISMEFNNNNPLEKELEESEDYGFSQNCLLNSANNNNHKLQEYFDFSNFNHENQSLNDDIYQFNHNNSTNYNQKILVSQNIDENGNRLDKNGNRLDKNGNRLDKMQTSLYKDNLEKNFNYNISQDNRMIYDSDNKTLENQFYNQYQYYNQQNDYDMNDYDSEDDDIKNNASGYNMNNCSLKNDELEDSVNIKIQTKNKTSKNIKKPKKAFNLETIKEEDSEDDI